MRHIERLIHKAQRRIWLNRWLRLWGWSTLAATVVWILLCLSDRLFALGIPVTRMAFAGAALALVVSFIWLGLTRESSLAAAAVLDQAAGLKERVSTGIQLPLDDQDPFRKAVLADAERSVAGLSARQLIPLRWTRSLSFCGVTLVVAVLSLLLPEFDLLNRKEAVAEQNARLNKLTVVRASVAKPISVIRKIADRNPEITDRKSLKNLEEVLRRGDQTDPDVLRRETAKQLDRLEDALRKQVDTDRFKALNETKKRLKKMGSASDPKTELGRLIESLSRGDFDRAQDAIKEVQEQLAKRAHGGKGSDKTVEKLRKQLNELSERLKSAAEDKQSQRALQNAGLSRVEAKRVLESLAKKDPEQLEKMAKEIAERLKSKGCTAEQIKKLLEQARQRQLANQQCNKMGLKMGDAAKQIEQGDMQAAVSELGEAAEMLSEMEQMEQALNELESQLSQVDQARDEFSQDDFEDELACENCKGTGFLSDGSPCPFCNGTGSNPGRGQRGRGWGERRRDDGVQTATRAKKGRVKTAKGGMIIGQQFIKGRQLKGKTEVEFSETASAAEVDAADALNRDRIPRMYRKGVRDYFDRLGKDYPSGRAKGQTNGPVESAED